MNNSTTKAIKKKGLVRSFGKRYEKHDWYSFSKKWNWRDLILLKIGKQTFPL